MTITTSLSAYHPITTTRQTATVARDLDSTAQARSYQQAQVATQPPATAVTETPTSNATPVQAYAVPTWLTSFGVSLNTLGTANMSGKDRALMAAEPQDRARLSELQQQHYSELLEEHGLSDIDARFAALTANPKLDGILHQQFNDSVSADAEMVALMSKIGVSLTPYG